MTIIAEKTENKALKKGLTSRQMQRIRSELAEDVKLETDSSLTWLDAQPDVDWKHDFNEKAKIEIIRDVVLGAIEDCTRLKTAEKLEDLEVFFSEPKKINEMTYPSLFDMYAAYLGHEQFWINRAKNYCLNRIKKAKQLVNGSLDSVTHNPMSFSQAT